MFEPSAYSPAIGDLLEEGRLQPLGPGTPNSSLRSRLTDLTPEKLFAPALIKDEDLAACCLSALWLYHDFLDESHRLSQDIETVEGSYWHGIMHRREPDYGNSKYWFRRVGQHPVFAALGGRAAGIAEKTPCPGEAALLKSQAAWDPFAFIDLCEKAARGNPDLELLCRKIGQAEWELLFDYCYRGALGERST